MNRLLAPEPPEIPAATLDDFEARTVAGLDPNSMMMKVGYRPNEQAVWGAMGVPGRRFRDEIGRAEWPKDDDAQREELKRTANFYQLTQIALEDIGMKDGEGWIGKWGITSAAEFNKNWAVQEDAMTLYMDHIERYMHGAGDELDLFDLRGQQIVGIHDRNNPITITPVGLMAAGHRWGAEGVRDYMEHVEKNGWVRNFDKLNKDKRDKYLAIETRLRTFRKYVI